MNCLQVDSYSFYRSIYSPVKSNMYVFIEGNEAFIFDTNICDDLLPILKEKSVNKIHLFLTHEHYDHSHGIIWLKRHFTTIIYCHTLCSEGLSTHKRSNPRLVALVIATNDKKNGEKNLLAFKESYKDYSFRGDYEFNKEVVLSVNSHEVQCIPTPGHTPGSSIYILDKKFVFSGDTFLLENKVITCFRGGSFSAFRDVTLPILKKLPDDITIMPGHGNLFKKEEFNFNMYDV